MSLHFLHLWTIGKKIGRQIFERGSINWIITQSILKVPEWATWYNIIGTSTLFLYNIFKNRDRFAHKFLS